MHYDFERAIDRRGTNSEKWSRKKIEDLCGNPDALPFWVADMDLITSDGITKAKEDIASQVIGYGSFDELVPLFASFVKQRHNWDINTEDVVYAQGMLHAISLAVNLFSDEGDEVLVPFPAYRPFMNICWWNNRVLVPYHLDYANGSFSFNAEKYAEISKSANIILFCSPHNPSGLVFKEEELKSVLTLAKERGQIVLSDEIHADLTHPSFTHLPMGKVNAKIGAKCLTFMAPSKTFNVAGEHCALVHFSDGELKAAYTKRQNGLYLSSPGYFIGSLATEAYRSGLEHNRELTSYLERNANYIEKRLKEDVGLNFSNGGASFVAFVDCAPIYDKVVKDKEAHPELYGSSGLMAHFFGQRAGICMNDGTWFGDDYKAFVRFNYGTSREMVELAIDRMERAIKAL